MKNLLIGAALLVATQVSLADKTEFQQQANALCEKMKACAMVQMGDVPPEFQGMVTAALDQACVSINNYEQITQLGNGLTEAGTACLKSMNAMSCEDIQNAEGDAITPECKEFEKQGEEFSKRYAQ